MSQCLDTQAIWSQMSEALRRYIRRRVSGVSGGSDEHTVDDLVQETFLRIQRNIGALRSADRMAPWVYQIARNVVHDHYRANHAHPRHAELSPDLADDSEPSPQDPLCGQGACWLDELIAQLPEAYQQAVRLAEIENLPQREVAARLGLSLSGAKSRIQRGRRLLKQALERCCVFHLDTRGNVIDIDPKPERTVCRSSCTPGPAPAPGGRDAPAR